LTSPGEVSANYGPLQRVIVRENPPPKNAPRLEVLEFRNYFCIYNGGVSEKKGVPKNKFSMKKHSILGYISLSIFGKHRNTNIICSG